MNAPGGPMGEHPRDDLAAYALDALDDAEREAVADHLAGCSVCRDDLAAYHETLVLLAPDETPPAALWERVAASIGAPRLSDPHTAERASSPPEFSGLPGADGHTSASALTGSTGVAGDGVDDVVRPFEPPARAARARARPPSRLRWMAAAASVAAAIAGGVVGFALGTSRGDDADIGSLAQRAAEEPGGELATLTDTGGQTVARVVADRDGAYVVLEGLDNLPEGRAYQLWSLTGPEPVSLGMLGREGTNTVAFRLPPTITEVAISIAPTSGDVAPDGEFLASGDVIRS